jgi:FkbM family methyltransferase
LTIKNLIKGTRLEAPLRRLFGREVNQLTDEEFRDRRDRAALEVFLKSIIQHDWNCIDIGANVGIVTRQMLSLATEGRVLAFEPQPHLAEKLRLRYPRAEVHEIALTDKNGPVSFEQVKEVSGWSGLKKQAYPKDVTTETLTVEGRRLDDVLPRDLRIDVIKIDTEGAEGLVLEGARETIERWKPVVIFEHAISHSINYDVTPEWLFRYFDSLGMEIYYLDGRGPLSESQLRKICYYSLATGYDRLSHTDFFARPK